MPLPLPLPLALPLALALALALALTVLGRMAAGGVMSNDARRWLLTAGHRGIASGSGPRAAAWASGGFG